MVFEGNSSDSPVIAIVGPTASGKTAVGIRAAELLGGEIISADSQAVYRGLDIGTAKPNLLEQSRARFHLVDVAGPDEPFNVARFKELAQAALSTIRMRGKRSLLVGGTGLYVRALLEDFSLSATPRDSELRSRLLKEVESRGAPDLHRRLATLDPAAAESIHPNDSVRIIRALEVFEITGVPISVQQAKDVESRKRLPARKFGISVAREELDRRIDHRVDTMVADGLVDEVRSLLNQGYVETLPSMRSLGYREICSFHRGLLTLQEAIDEIKRNTRRFARRQMTWFRADREIEWIDAGPEPGAQVEEIVSRIVSSVQAPRIRGI